MKQGDIVLVPFPFTDLSEIKTRPALVISNESFNQHRNVILMAISTKAGQPKLAESIHKTDLSQGMLKKVSFCRAQNVFTLEKRLILKSVARLTPEKTKKICQTYQHFFEFESK